MRELVSEEGVAVKINFLSYDITQRLNVGWSVAINQSDNPADTHTHTHTHLGTGESDRRELRLECR